MCPPSPIHASGRECVCIPTFFFNDTATTEIYTLSLHDALPIFSSLGHRFEGLAGYLWIKAEAHFNRRRPRSEEHTSELQSHVNLVCRLLLEKKKKYINYTHLHTHNMIQSTSTFST